MNRNVFLRLGVLVILLAFRTQQVISVGALDGLDNVDTITADNFDAEVAKNHLFVLFYASG